MWYKKFVKNFYQKMLENLIMFNIKKLRSKCMEDNLTIKKSCDSI